MINIKIQYIALLHSLCKKKLPENYNFEDPDQVFMKLIRLREAEIKLIKQSWIRNTSLFTTLTKIFLCNAKPVQVYFIRIFFSLKKPLRYLTFSGSALAALHNT